MCTTDCVIRDTVHTANQWLPNKNGNYQEKHERKSTVLQSTDYLVRPNLVDPVNGSGLTKIRQFSNFENLNLAQLI